MSTPRDNEMVLPVPPGTRSHEERYVTDAPPKYPRSSSQQANNNTNNNNNNNPGTQEQSGRRYDSDNESYYEAQMGPPSSAPSSAPTSGPTTSGSSQLTSGSSVLGSTSTLNAATNANPASISRTRPEQQDTYATSSRMSSRASQRVYEGETRGERRGEGRGERRGEERGYDDGNDAARYSGENRAYAGDNRGYAGDNRDYAGDNRGYAWGDNRGYEAERYSSHHGNYPSDNGYYPGDNGVYPRDNEAYPRDNGAYPRDNAGYNENDSYRDNYEDTPYYANDRRGFNDNAGGHSSNGYPPAHGDNGDYMAAAEVVGRGGLRNHGNPPPQQQQQQRQRGEENVFAGDPRSTSSRRPISGDSRSLQHDSSPLPPPPPPPMNTSAYSGIVSGAVDVANSQPGQAVRFAAPPRDDDLYAAPSTSGPNAADHRTPPSYYSAQGPQRNKHPASSKTITSPTPQDALDADISSAFQQPPRRTSEHGHGILMRMVRDNRMIAAMQNSTLDANDTLHYLSEGFSTRMQPENVETNPVKVQGKDLVAKNHEDILLLLIKLKRNQAFLEQEKLYYMKQLSANIAYDSEEYKQLIKQKDELSRQIEVNRPLLSLISNIVSTDANSNKKFTSPPIKPSEIDEEDDVVKLMIQDKLKILHDSDVAIQNEKIIINNMQEDKNVIERSVLDLRTSESNEIASNKAKEIQKKMNSMLTELESLKTQMAKRSKKLELDLATNRNLENEVLSLKMKIIDSPSDHTNSRVRKQLTYELANLETVVDTLSTKGSDLHVLMDSVRRITNHSYTPFSVPELPEKYNPPEFNESEIYSNPISKVRSPNDNSDDIEYTIGQKPRRNKRIDRHKSAASILFPAANESADAAPSVHQNGGGDSYAANQSRAGGRGGAAGDGRDGRGNDDAYNDEGQRGKPAPDYPVIGQTRRTGVTRSPSAAQVPMRQHQHHQHQHQQHQHQHQHQEDARHNVNTPLSVDVSQQQQQQRERQMEKIRGIERERRVTVTSELDHYSASSTPPPPQQQPQPQPGADQAHDDSKEYRRQLEREVERQTDARMARNVFKDKQKDILPAIVNTQPKQSSFELSFDRSVERTRRVSDLMTPRPFHSTPNTIKSISQSSFDKSIERSSNSISREQVAVIRPTTNSRQSISPDSIEDEIFKNANNFDDTAGPILESSNILKSSSANSFVDLNTLEEVVMPPEKVDIPERYISKDDDHTESEIEFQLKKSNSIKKLLAAQSLQDWSKGEVDLEGSDVHEDLEKERNRREKVLEARQTLAKQVMAKSRKVAGRWSMDSSESWEEEEQEILQVKSKPKQALSFKKAPKAKK